jgi:hypothetical protein
LSERLPLKDATLHRHAAHNGRVDIVREFCVIPIITSMIDLAPVFRDPTGSAPSASTH